MIISKEGQIIRIESQTIRQAGRSTQGVTLVKMEGEDRVSAASVVPDSPEEEAGEEQGPVV
jgi:DNA gyrase subunit A